MNFLSRRKLMILNLFLLAVSAVYACYGYLHGIKALFCDGFLRWQECACVLHGIYPMDIILGRRPSIKSFGLFDNTTTTIPWSYTLSNFFYPGFLSWTGAKIWALALFTAAGIFCAVMLFRCLRRRFPDSNIRVMFVLIWFSSFGWGSAIGKLNNGMFTCLSLLLVLLLLEYYPDTLKYEVLIGLLMTAAMLKPQIALLFYIPLLFMKRYRSIILSGAVTLAGWLGASAVLQVAPLTILSDQFHVGADLHSTSVYVYYGILDFLTRFSFTTRTIMLLQVCLFVPLAFWLGWKLRHASLWLQFSIPSVFALLWCYHHNTDLEIIGILMIALAQLMLSRTGSHIRLFCLLLLLFNLIPISYTYYVASPIIPLLQRLFYIAGLFILLRCAPSEWFHRPILPPSTDSNS